MDRTPGTMEQQPAEAGQPEPPPREGSAPSEAGQPESPPREGSAASVEPRVLPERCNVLMLSFLLFCGICFVVWAVLATQHYRRQNAQATEGWRVGTTRYVEITLVKQDRFGLACDSSQDFWGLRCSGHTDLSPTGPDPKTLQPFNTSTNQLFLGAGLWSSPEMQKPLPDRRFTVGCNFHIKGIVKSARIRFAPTGRFVPLNTTVTAGTLTDCMVPR